MSTLYEYILNTFIIYNNCYLYNILISKEVILMQKQTIRINKKGEDGYKVISVRIKENVLKKVDNLSQKSNRSRNELINIILESSVDNVEIN